MSFIGYAYRFASNLASALNPRPDNDALELGIVSSRPLMKGRDAAAHTAEVQIDVGRTPMKGGYAHVQKKTHRS